MYTFLVYRTLFVFVWIFIILLRCQVVNLDILGITVPAGAVCDGRASCLDASTHR